MVDQPEEENLDFLETGPIDKGNTQGICHACCIGSLPAVKYYYEANPFNVNIRARYLFNRTPLHFASRQGHLLIVKFLISKGAEVDAVDADKETPLMLTCEQGHLPVIEYLLKKGANINHENIRKWTPIYKAIFNAKDLPSVKLLIEMGANYLIKDSSDFAPMDLASKFSNCRSIINYLKTLDN